MMSASIKRRFRGWACVIVLASCPTAVAQDLQPKGTSGGLFIAHGADADPRVCCLGDPKLKVTIGQKATGTAWFWCQDTSTGEYLPDNVEVFVFGAPRRHGEKAPVVDPSPVDTFPFNRKGTDITIDTVYKRDKELDTTTPKNYYPGARAVDAGESAL
jgi:hypothetical protein